MKNPNLILAFDLGTHTGWACGLGPKIIASGSEDFTPSKLWDGGPGLRFLKFDRWLSGPMGSLIVKDFKTPPPPLTHVFYERVPFQKGRAAAHVYLGMLAVLQAWAEKEEIIYEGVPIHEIKRHATGSSKASKVDLITAARSRGIEPVDDNMADALMLYYYAIEALIP